MTEWMDDCLSQNDEQLQNIISINQVVSKETINSLKVLQLVKQTNLMLMWEFKTIIVSTIFNSI